MKFCSECSNMYYITLNDKDSSKLQLYCISCGHIDDNINNDTLSIDKYQTKKKSKNYTTIINEYTKLDPTLPRTSKFKCPSEKCSKENPVSNIIYIRYDDTDMKYIYLCSYCDSSWNT